MKSQASGKRFWWLDDENELHVVSLDEKRQTTPPAPRVLTAQEQQAVLFWQALQRQAHGGPLATDPGA